MIMLFPLTYSYICLQNTIEFLSPVVLLIVYGNTACDCSLLTLTLTKSITDTLDKSTLIRLIR